jgi:hypothetical protein
MERRRPALSTSSESTNTDDEGQAPTSNSCGPAVVESESEEHPVVVTAEGEGPYEKAIKYLEKHKIISLFQALTTSVLQKKPADPLQFLSDELERLQTEKRRRNPTTDHVMESRT